MYMNKKLSNLISLSLSLSFSLFLSLSLSLSFVSRVAAGLVAAIQPLLFDRVRVSVVYVYSVGVMCGGSVSLCAVVAVIVSSVIVVERDYLAVVYTTWPPSAHGRVYNRLTVLYNRVRCM